MTKKSLRNDFLHFFDYKNFINIHKDYDNSDNSYEFNSFQVYRVSHMSILYHMIRFIFRFHQPKMPFLALYQFNVNLK